MLDMNIRLWGHVDGEWYRFNRTVLTRTCQTLRSALGSFPCAPALDP